MLSHTICQIAKGSFHLVNTNLESNSQRVNCKVKSIIHRYFVAYYDTYLTEYSSFQIKPCEFFKTALKAYDKFTNLKETHTYPLCLILQSSSFGMRGPNLVCGSRRISLSSVFDSYTPFPFGLMAFSLFSQFVLHSVFVFSRRRLSSLS